MNKTLKSIFAIGGIVLLTSFFFTSCAVDDNEVDTPPTESEQVKPDPVDDVIETIIMKDAAIFGNNFDEVTQKVIDRLKGITHHLDPVTTSVIPENVELIFIDNESLLKMERPAVMAIKEAFLNGTMVYLHKPNDFAAMLFNIAMFDDIDSFFDSNAKKAVRTRASEDLQSFDLFAIRADQSYLAAEDLFNEKPIEQTFVDIESGEETTQSFTPSAPNNYQIGRYAENTVKWIESESAATVRSKVRSASNSDDPFAQHHISVLIPCNLHYPSIVDYLSNRPKIDANFNITIEMWVTTAYSFDKKMDYYNIVMKELFKGGEAYKGKYWNFGDYWREFEIITENQRKTIGINQAGYVYDGPDVYVYKPEGYTVNQPTTEAPVNQNNINITESYSGWSAGAEIGYSDGSIGGKLSFNYKKGETVKSIAKDLKVTLKRDYSRNNKKVTFWDYEIGNNKWKECGMHEKISSDAFCINDCDTKQYWEWFIDNTTSDISNNIEFDVEFVFPAYVAKQELNGNYKVSRFDVAKKKVRFKLPIPYRYRETYQIKAYRTRENEEDAEKVEKEISKVLDIDDFKLKRSNTTKNALDAKMMSDWNNIIDNLLLNIQVFVDHEVSVYLIDNNRNRIGDRLVFSPDSPEGYPQREKVE